MIMQQLYLQDGATVDALVELRAVEVVREEDDLSGNVMERAVQEVGVLHLGTWLRWELRWSWATDVNLASGVLWAVARVSSDIPVLAAWAEGLVSESIVTLQEHSAVGRVRKLNGISRRSVVDWAAGIETLAGDQANQGDCQDEELHDSLSAFRLKLYFSSRC